MDFDAAHAAAVEGRVLWSARRVSHPSGNAEAFDARKAELRAYHTEWVGCWEELAEAGACREERASDADATTRAVRLSECEQSTGREVSRRPGFRRCLAARGHPEARPPRWTRDDFGMRFPGPYWTLTALLAEDLGGAPAASRVAGALLGVAFPVALVLAAVASLRRATAGPPPGAEVGGRGVS